MPYDEVRGRLIHYNIVKITLDSSGDGSKSFLFNPVFVGTPNVFINEPKFDAGSYSTSNVTNEGFTLTVDGSDLVSQDIEVGYIAMELI